MDRADAVELAYLHKDALDTAYIEKWSRKLDLSDRGLDVREAATSLHDQVQAEE